MRLAHLAVEEPSVALALVRMGMEQHAIMERVYCGNGDSPVARVAALFEYLMEKRSVPKIIRDGKGQPVVTVSTSTTVDGPTQLDVADALGLGRATVEKAIATLRTEGALVAPARGARTNRLYEIRDRSVLGVMALGLDPSVGPADRDT
ncbi:hypothetical protein [Streptomyces sp. NPDC007264]|uniref:hypothetical protein n=1 Tax=Streptomyces sp. NPDC007264 TaxID=3364777 RepID=UPI0036DDA755